jgi:tetratricopeptide (TPR) repeat protein
LLQVKQLSGGAMLSLSYLAFVYGILGKTEEALDYLRQIEDFQQAHPELLKYSDLCFSWWGIGDHDKAFENLLKAIEKREEMLGYMVNSPLYVIGLHGPGTGLHDDPRFQEVKKKMNL